ncbi:TPX2, C-terminal [Dillenia turbinata]|uniref:TPX2, C-terminal n=1 Tax=Dillenia turbinata TaxID=194707 RepID=A0AAN8V7D5_9MAGN
MDPVVKNTGIATPVKESKGFQSKLPENCDPNVSNRSPGVKPKNSPAVKSAKAQKLASRNPNPQITSPRNRIRERRFVVVKKNSKREKSSTEICSKCKDKNSQKCLCVAYETLRASQEEFFKTKTETEEIEEDPHQLDPYKNDERAKVEDKEEIEKNPVSANPKISNGSEEESPEQENSSQSPKQIGSSKIKRRREKVMEEARNSVPESGKVMHLVQAFERLLSIPNSKNRNDENEENPEEKNEEKKRSDEIKKSLKWPLPGLQLQPWVSEPSSSSFCPSEIFSFVADSRVSSSLDSSQGSSESVGSMGRRRWKKKQLKPTSQKPFKLKTEQRGMFKKEEFLKKLEEMRVEEEKLRIPIAQGLPWTTDEPEPPVKECTIPVDLKLHSDVRAIERAEFDHQVAEKMTLIEQYRMERARQQKLVEEEDVRRLRKELLPKAQPMPYFDRPFIPRRSSKQPTIPKEPKFHIPHHKKLKCLSWNDLFYYPHQHQQEVNSDSGGQ